MHIDLFFILSKIQEAIDSDDVLGLVFMVEDNMNRYEISQFRKILIDIRNLKSTQHDCAIKIDFFLKSLY